jgi:ATP-dependent protease ClpP protease subunit
VNKRRRGILAALQPAVDVALKRPAHTGDVPGFHVRNEGTTRELMIYGRIGGGGWFDEGIGASDVAAALRDLGSGPIDVRINSGGGDVFDGVAIHSLLARHAGTVTMHIDGLAASAASFIAMAGDRIVMARNGFMMIHDGMTFTYGNRDTHVRNGELLDKVSDNIADMYAERAGEDVAHWRNLMTVNGEDGTWYTGQEALEAGLVDDITGGEDEKEARAAATLLAGWRDALPEKISAALVPEDDSDDDDEPAGEPAPPLTEEPDPQPEEAAAPVNEEDDFRFRMQMWQWANNRAGTVKEMENA